MAQTGREGLEKAIAFVPEIVFCDIGLPDISGYAVVESLRRTPGVGSPYIIAITGYGQEEDRNRAAQAGFDDYLTKPVAKADLEKVLTEFSRREPSIVEEQVCG